MDKQSLELLLAQGLSIEKIAKRFGKDPSTIGRWVNKHGLKSPYADKHAAKGGIDRARLEELVEAGMSIAEIAEEVNRSKATVRHWLRRYGMKTKNAVGRRRPGVAQAAMENGLLSITMTCKHHGDTEFVLEGRGRYRCKQCRLEAVTRRRRKVKAILVEEAGGRCCACGYDDHVGVLQFHHLDPNEKRYDVSRYGVTLSLESARSEAAKCVLLCPDCHAEVEGGHLELPARVARAHRPPEPAGSG